uniref:Poly [ADP-ribose] polymerase n=1 Tax=Varanus komodoensis TaxID=61221 RepID=A0A8D2LUX6_VARKO
MHGVGQAAASNAATAHEAIRKGLLAADLKCSFFVSALQSYKRDSVLRPFPGLYATEENKDFEALVSGHLFVTQSGARFSLARSKCESCYSPQSVPQSLGAALKLALYKKIEELTGAPSVPVPAPDFLFEVTYCNQMNAKFEETRAGRGLIYAFHGSHLENFHSIVHNGLHCHLNRTSLFGEGTYLTSDLSLALLYSPHGLGWQRSVMGPILSCVAVCEIIDHPDVKCQAKKKDSKEIDKKRARVKNSEGGDVPQKYFVVTNNQLIRVKYLLVYSQKQHRSSAGQSWLSKHRFAVIMILYLLLLIIIGASNSPAFLYYRNRLFDSKW